MAIQSRIPRLALLLACWLGTAGAGVPGVPAWRSLRDPLVNMRTGPGEDYAIRFVYHRQHMPVRMLREYQGWAFVADPDGARGWILERFLAKTRSALVRGPGPVEMHGSPGGPLLWRLSPGVVGQLGACSDGWCQIEVEHRLGYVPEARLWGVGNP